MTDHDPNTFQQIATLCYVIDDGEVLLMRKKRGIGEGLINGPGGKIEDHDESPRHAAIRETEEELGVTPEDPEKVGELDFFFGDDPFQRVHVFIASDYDGKPEETEEADPVWVNTDEMPYDEMWDDDRYWMPLMFEGAEFTGTFRFDEDGDVLQDWKLQHSTF